VNEGPASLGGRRGNRKGGGIYVKGEGEKDERGRNRWQVLHVFTYSASKPFDPAITSFQENRNPIEILNILKMYQFTNL